MAEVQVLVAAVNQNMETMPEQMNLQSDAVIVNQCDTDSVVEYTHQDHKILGINRNERGVGKSRNTALKYATADLVLFSDEDIVYFDGYEEKLHRAFAEHPKADVITFNFEVDERRRTYYNEETHTIHWYNYGRYPAYAIAARREALEKAGIVYSLLFGGGAKYSNGEDSLFLHDCLKAKLRLLASTELLGKENYRESTWFSGYHEKFFFDRGVLYHYLYGRLAALFSLRFLFSNRKVMLTNDSIWSAYRIMKRGIREAKRIEK